MELLFHRKMLTNEPNYLPLSQGIFCNRVASVYGATLLPASAYEYGNECTTLE